MKKLSDNNQIKVVPEALKVAIGAAALAAILYYLDVQFGILKTLDINQDDVIMVAGSAVAFCLLWVILHTWFFTPYIKLFERREKLTVGAAEDFLEKENEIAKMLEKHEIMTLEARAQSMQEKSAAVSKAKAEANEAIENAKVKAQAAVSKAKEELQQKKKQLQNDAQKEAEVLASEMVSKILSIAFLILVAASVLAYAPLSAYASSEGQGDAAHHESGLMSIKFYIINFAIYAVLIFAIAKKNIPGAWASRKRRLESTIKSSLQKKEIIDRAYEEARVKLSKVDSDIQIIKKSISEETQREIEDVRNYAKASIERIEKQVKDTLGAEERSLENAMRKIYGEAAIKLAESKLRAELNIEKDKSLRNRTLENMRGIIQ